MKSSANLPRGFVPLRTRLSILISLTVLVFGTLNLWVAGRLTFLALTREQEHRMQFAATLLAQRAEELLLYDDRVALDQLVRQSRSIDPHLAYIILSDPIGRPVVHTFETSLPSWVLGKRVEKSERPTIVSLRDTERRRYHDIAVEILDGRLGTVRIGVDDAGIHTEVVRVLSVLAAMVGVFLLAGLVGARFVAGRMTDPLGRVTRDLERFRLDGPPLDLAVHTRDELEVVAGHIAKMAERLQDLFRRERSRQRELARMERLAALGTLAAGIAHEVNNPLAGVKNAVQRLTRHSHDAGRVERYANVISESARRIERTVKTTLDFSRPREPRPQPVDVATCLQKSLALAEPRMLEVQARVQSDNAAGAAMVKADPDLLVQVFLNLLLNAADAVDGGADRTVTVRTGRPLEGRLAVTVRDSGPGVPAEMAEFIFDPFYTTKSPGSGSGLGLSISWTAMKEMGGKLVLEDPGSRGASFRVELPTWETES
jgi:signal transduction histidine kinase